MSRAPVAYALVVGLAVLAACVPQQDPSRTYAGHFAHTPEEVSARRYERLQRQLGAEPGAVRTGLGSVYRDVEAGSGRAPSRTDTVTVRYRTFDGDGVVVEDSAQYGGAVTVDLAELPRCLQQTVMRMRVGGTSRVVCPMPESPPPTASLSPPLIVETTLLAVGAPLPPPGH